MIVVALLDDPLNVGNGGSNKEGDSKGGDVEFGSPKTDKDSVEDTKDDESPTDALNGDLSAGIGELVEDKAKEMKDQMPNVQFAGVMYVCLGLYACCTRGW
jgi:hypothetical protein